MNDDTIESYLNYSPLFAAVVDKTPDEQHEVFEEFVDLATPVKTFLADPETAQKLEALTIDGTVPEEYATAVGKLVYFVVTGQAQLSNIGQLLTKIGMPADKAALATQRLSELIEPVMDAMAQIQALQEQPVTTQEIPPLTSKILPPTTPMPGQGTAQRNIIDLRPQK